MMHRLLIIGLISTVFSLSACGKKLEADKALEQYLLQESGLKGNSWEYYTVQKKPGNSKELVAYLIFPKKSKTGRARVAPIQSELTRLCPDKKIHGFWSHANAYSVKLILIKNVNREGGRATRLAQVNCSPNFDLVAYEGNMIQAEKERKNPWLKPSKDSADKQLWLQEIIAALRNDDADKVEKLVAGRPQYVNMRDAKGQALLHLCKSAASAKPLIKAGAKVDALNEYGTTPLMYAADHKNPDFAHLLIKNGANVNHKNKRNATPLSKASSMAMAELLVSNGAIVPKDALLDAILFASVDYVSFLVEKGADVNAKSIGKDTPLHKSAFYSTNTSFGDQVKVAKWLIDNGAALNTINNAGQTPLDVAQKGYGVKPNQRMLKLLQDSGGRRNKRISAK